MGAINGMGDGTFAPNANVTGEQAVKMMVSTIGYGLRAESEGGYPAGFVAVARDIGALKGLANVKLEEPMTRGQAAILCANILEIDVMKKVSAGDTERWEAKEGEKVLRAKIDMSHPNINMRDPVLYRIIYTSHHRHGNKWCIYPMYDFAHPLQDAFEGVTHSLCSLEYDNHRVLYDWVIEKCNMPHVSHQYEFGRLNITNTVMSIRYLKQLVESKKVIGYDDPRMPTLTGMRRRGITPEAIKNFILSTGLSRINSTVEGELTSQYIKALLENKGLKITRIGYGIPVGSDLQYADELTLTKALENRNELK
jgi:hypothetical protein